MPSIIKYPARCQLCGTEKTSARQSDPATCPTCEPIIDYIENHPETVRKAWQYLRDDPILPRQHHTPINDQEDLPDVLDGKRYRTIDRDNNKWYLSVSEVMGKPVEVFASTAFDRDHELQSRISNLTTITRLISLLLRHIFLGERITFDKCLKQIQRSSRQKNDLPDMLHGVLERYGKNGDEKVQQHAE